MSDFIDRARAFDRDATEGPWEVDHAGDNYSTYADGALMRSVASEGRAITWDDHGGEVFKSEDAEFIAAARSMLPAAVEALARVRGLHRPVESQWGDQACAECLNSWELEVVWPCPTYKATEVQA